MSISVHCCLASLESYREWHVISWETWIVAVPIGLLRNKAWFLLLLLMNCKNRGKANFSLPLNFQFFVFDSKQRRNLGIKTQVDYLQNEKNFIAAVKSTFSYGISWLESSLDGDFFRYIWVFGDLGVRKKIGYLQIWKFWKTAVKSIPYNAKTRPIYKIHPKGVTRLI